MTTPDLQPDPSTTPTSAPAIEPELPLLSRPRDPMRPVVVDERTLRTAVASLAEGRGPLAVDAERASGYRYGQRAYLVQLRRDGAGTWLIDPIACPDLSEVQAATRDVEWVLHAATQDLPCLTEVGLAPSRLVDTELGSRLAGLARVGLGAVVEHYLGVRLAKEHSAVDWSTRPLPEPWLVYAALDVEILVDLRDAVEADLREQGKWEWALEEFEHLTHFEAAAPRAEPWRRLSGVHHLRTRRANGVARELWDARDRVARSRDTAPGRIVPDAVLVAIASDPSSLDARLTRGLARYRAPLAAAVERAMLLPDADLPRQPSAPTGPPPPRAWADRDPVAAARLTTVRDLLAARSEELAVPVENLMTPGLLRRTLWEPPADETRAGVEAALLERGARRWQVDIVAPIVTQAFADHPREP